MENGLEQWWKRWKSTMWNLIIEIIIVFLVVFFFFIIRRQLPEEIYHFIVGLAITLALSDLLVVPLHKTLYRKILHSFRPDYVLVSNGLPSAITGMIERLLFFSIAFFMFSAENNKVENLPIMALIWLGLKLASNWQRSTPINRRIMKSENEDEYKKQLKKGQIKNEKIENWLLPSDALGAFTIAALLCGAVSLFLTIAGAFLAAKNWIPC